MSPRVEVRNSFSSVACRGFLPVEGSHGSWQQAGSLVAVGFEDGDQGFRPITRVTSPASSSMERVFTAEARYRSSRHIEGWRRHAFTLVNPNLVRGKSETWTRLR